jgi:hypothetical protein
MKLYQNVSPSQELREASNAVDALVREYGVASSMRVDVYQAKIAAEKNAKSSGEWEKLSPEAQRLAEKMLLDGRRAGLDLPDAQRKELEALKKELEYTCLDFCKNCTQENVSLRPVTVWIESHFHFGREQGKIIFTLEELEGVPPDVVSGYTKRTEDSRELYDITFKEPDISPVVSLALACATLVHILHPHSLNTPRIPRLVASRGKSTKTDWRLTFPFSRKCSHYAVKSRNSSATRLGSTTSPKSTWPVLAVLPKQCVRCLARSRRFS